MKIKQQEIKKKRILSIDILRGFDMFWITGGTEFVYSLFYFISIPIANFLGNQFSHVAWNGFHFYDLIFSLFVFISGLSIPIAINNRREKGDSDKLIYIHIIKRSFLLWLLGYLRYNFLEFDWNAIRWFGVLQRIAICYFFSALIYMKMRKISSQVVITSILLLVYWALMMLIPVPGYGPGILTPEGNLAGYIDRLLIPGHYCCYTYGDSEGLLSTIPAISTCMLGVLNGQWIKKIKINHYEINKEEGIEDKKEDKVENKKSEIKEIFRLIGVGVILIILALVWNLNFPINKNLWSSSFVLLTGGLSMILLGFFYILIDIYGLGRIFYYFLIIGSNSLLIYMISGSLGCQSIVDLFLEPGPVYDLIRSIMSLTIQWVILYIFYRKKWFIKI